jgi:hypothetical protein
MAVQGGRWFAAIQKGSSNAVYTRKQGSEVVIFDYNSKPKVLNLRSVEWCKDHYRVLSAVDDLTQQQLDVAVSRMDQSQDMPSAHPTSNGTTPKVVEAPKPQPTKPLTGAVAGVNDTTLSKIHRESTKTVTGKGGLDEQERRVNRMEAAVERLKGQELILVQYDVHSKSYTLEYKQWWRRAFRLGESVWIFTQDSISDSYIQEVFAEMVESGVTVDVLPQSERTKQKLLEIAQRNLSAEITRIHTSLIERLDSASERLEAARKELEAEEEKGKEVTHRDYQKLESKKDNECRAILKSAAEALNTSIECARRFDVTEHVADLLRALREAVRSQALSFDASMKAKGSKDSGIVL